MKRFWREMMAADFARDTSRWIAVLPLAAIEQHGPHLPSGTDAMIAEGAIERIAKALPNDSPTVFLPLQQIGKSDEHISFPGTLTIGWQTMIESGIAIGESVARAGIRKLLIVTSHGGNLAGMEIIARELRLRRNMLVVCTSFEKLAPPKRPADGMRIDIHGGPYETSLMLALRPDLVDMEKARDFPSRQSAMKEGNRHLGFHSSDATIAWRAEDLNADGVTGDATSATAEAGEATLAAMAENFRRLIDEIRAAEIPQAG